MNLSTEDKELLEELCEQHDLSYEKILKLMCVVRDYELKNRRSGVYDALKNVLQSTDGTND
jgi:enamine deaminase RidA (YjgF/YER057c/UK114 family)